MTISILFRNQKWNLRIIISYLLCVINLLFMHYVIIGQFGPEFPFDNTSWIDNLSGVIFDITILFLTFIFITWKRPKATICIAYIITLIWAFCNILYSRFFHSYLSLSAIGQSHSILDPIVIKSAFHGFQWSDIFFIVSPLTFYYNFKKTPRTSLYHIISTPTTFLACIFVLDFIAHAIYCISVPQFRYISYYEERLTNRHLSKLYTFCEPRRATYHRGSIRTLVIEALDAIHDPIQLSENQKQAIQEAIKMTRNSMVSHTNNKSSIQNVILIIVESYMSFTSGLTIDGKEITPYLNKLREDSSIYYNGQVEPNITIGESADGQYIYMTGLLPLRSVITISKAQNKTLPGLPKIARKKGMNSRMIIPTQSSMWNQSAMCKQYGFDVLHSCDDYPKKYNTLNDQQIFEFASSIDKQSKNYFFSVILTMSMHQPYDTILDESFIIQDSTISDELKCYLNACHYMDRQLGLYIERLKDYDLYNNSLIIITADHHVHNTSFGPHIKNDLPLYIINGGFNNKEAWHGQCNQIDVYTTILDILNLSPTWCGLGHSLLSSDYYNSLSDTKWDISEWILRSDFFNK